MPRNLFAFLIAAPLLACTGSRESVHESRFQKRRHVNGWHLDLHARQADAPQRFRLKALVPRTAPVSGSAPIQEREPIASAKGDPAVINAPQLVEQEERMRAIPSTTAARTEQQEEDENLMPRKKWNAVAVPAFVSALGTVALGFGTNLWLLVGAIALTFILCAWSIARIRRKEQAGKGFTMAALIIGVLSALLTLMSIGRYGTEL